MRVLLALSCTIALALPIQAQTVQRQAQVYRCGPEGRDLRDSPCPGGSGASTIAFDEPSPADQRAARERHLAESRQAAALAQARRASEAAPHPPRAQRIGPQPAPPAPAPAASAPRANTAKPPKLARPHKPAAASTSASSAARGR